MSLTVEELLAAAWDSPEAFAELRAQWTTAYINDLPDSAFAYVEAGGKKDEDGKTTPRSKRHFPHHDAAGKLDLPHLRNALSRAPQSPHGPKALPHLKRHAKAAGVGQEEDSVNLEEIQRLIDSDFELRTYDAQIEIRAADDDDEMPTLVGHAAVFNRDSLPLAEWGGTKIIERVAPGAFKKTLKEADIRALFNHNPDIVLGRNRSKTLKLAEDERGLAVEISPPDTQTVRDLVIEPMRRGDINQMSFGFRVVKDKFEEARDTEKSSVVITRTLLEVKLFDVSPVTMPAYPDTDVKLRSLFGAADVDLDQLGTALMQARSGQPLCEGDCAILTRATEELARYLPGHEPDSDHSDEEPIADHSTVLLRQRWEHLRTRVAIPA